VYLLSANLDDSIAIGFYVIRSELENEPKDIDRAYQLEERNSELQLELVRCIQESFETIGNIINLFHIAPDHKLIEGIYEMLSQITGIEGDPELNIPSDIKSIEDLAEWNDKARKKIREIIVPHIAEPIDLLLKHLEQELEY
jgi:hypothetical protein